MTTDPNNCRRGVTLIEIMLSVILLAILAVLSVNSLFYPRYLIVNSNLEQTAINAGNSQIERHIYNAGLPGPTGLFETDGWLLTSSNFTWSATEVTNYFGGEAYNYLIISNTVTYRDGKTVEFVTCRSLEVNSSLR